MEVYLESMSCRQICGVFEWDGQGQARGRAPVFPSTIIRGVSRESVEKRAQTVQRRPARTPPQGQEILTFSKARIQGATLAKHIIVPHWGCLLLEICDNALGRTCTSCRCIRSVSTTLSRHLCTRCALCLKG